MRARPERRPRRGPIRSKRPPRCRAFPHGRGWVVDHGPLYAWEEQEGDAWEWAAAAAALLGVQSPMSLRP